MIDTIREQQTTCKACGRPIRQKTGKGHRKRVFCSPRCKQADYRQHHHVNSNVTGNVTIDDTMLQAKPHIFDRAKMEARFMHLGEQVQYHPLTTFSIFGGFVFRNQSMSQKLLTELRNFL